MDVQRDHITVCICTYKRPSMLLHLLKELQQQETDGLFTYSVVIVDNDAARSAEAQVRAFREESVIDIEYHCEPVQNIALARNRAVLNARGTHVAFLDDDEYPDRMWLLSLYRALREFKADGVLGPVHPHFEAAPPKWIIKGKFCERSAFATGTVLRNSRDTRTGNVLLARRLFQDRDLPFDPQYGKTGGEDTAFFKRMIEQGKKFVWSNEGAVHESVSRDRLTRAYFLKRALLRGMINSKRMSVLSIGTLRSLAAVFVYTAALPLLLLIRHDLFMKYLVKDFDHIGKLLAFCGIEAVSDRAGLGTPVQES